MVRHDHHRDYPRILTPPPGPKAKAIIDRDAAVDLAVLYQGVPAGHRRRQGRDGRGRGRQPLHRLHGGHRRLGDRATTIRRWSRPSRTRPTSSCTSAGPISTSRASPGWPSGWPGWRRARAGSGPSSPTPGTEAIEGAIKLARYHTRRPALIAFHGSFHGRSYGAMSLTSSKVKQHKHFGPFLPEVYHVPYANPYRAGGDQAAIDAVARARCRISSPARSRRTTWPRIFVEPIQGEGGYVIPPLGFLKALRELCDQHGILLVADEVQSGVGPDREDVGLRLGGRRARHPGHRQGARLAACRSARSSPRSR